MDKPLEDYFKDKRGRQGRYAKCKTCHNAAVAVSSAKPESKAKRSARLAGQRDHINARQRAYWKAHPELARYHADYDSARPEARQARVNRRRARKAAAEGSHTQVEWLALCEAAGHRCLRCGRKRKLTRDHVVPLSQGGTDYIDNIQPLCFSCNASKGAKMVDYRRNNDTCELPG